MKKRNIKNRILTQLIQEALNNFLYLAEDDDDPDDPILGFLDDDPKPKQLSWLDGQGADDIANREEEADEWESGSYLDDSEMSLPWDDRLGELADLLTGISLDVIDHYKGRPGFGPEEAKKEIMGTVGVPLDIFFGKEEPFSMGNYHSLDEIIAEWIEEEASSDELSEDSEGPGDEEDGDTTAADPTIYSGNAPSNPNGMRELGEDRKK